MEEILKCTVTIETAKSTKELDVSLPMPDSARVGTITNSELLDYVMKSSRTVHIVGRYFILFNQNGVDFKGSLHAVEEIISISVEMIPDPSSLNVPNFIR